MPRSPVDTPAKTATLRQMIGRRMRRMLELSGSTADQLAACLNVSRRTIFYWIDGTHAPSSEHIFMMATLWDIPVEYLLLGTDIEPIPRSLPLPGAQPVEVKDG